MQTEPAAPEKDGANYFIPCGHYSNNPNENCLTCRQFADQEDFRAVVIRNQDSIRKTVLGQTPGKKPLCIYIDESPHDRLDCNCTSKWIHSCDVYGDCCRDDPQNKFGIQSCSACPQHVPRDSKEDCPEFRRVILIDKHAPGDVSVMTAAVDSLHKAHPGRFVVDVESCAPAVWEGNPGVRKLSGEARDSAERHEIKYEAINKSNELPIHFMEAYCWGLSEALGVRIPLSRNTPHIVIKDEEKSWHSQVTDILGAPGVPYVVVNAGYKTDFTAKFWGFKRWSELVSIISKQIVVVQVGEDSEGHVHRPIDGALNLIGKTDQRQLIRLIANAKAAVGPPTFIQHIAAGVGTPYVLIAGGREPVIWQHYPKQITLSSIGTLSCCADGGCWRTRTVKLGDDTKHDKSICEFPIISGIGNKAYDVTPKCLTEISPSLVADQLKKLFRIRV
jgi:hypothetical protein